VATHERNKPATPEFGLACDPLNDIYHEFMVDDIHVMTTGQPVVIYAATQAEAYDKVFSEYTLDESGQLETYAVRETTLSIDYTEADAIQTAADAMEAAPGLLIRPVKHPDRDEWAMNVSAHVITTAPPSAKKDEILAKHASKVAGGKNKDKATAKQEGW
jgi:hypothetical protein